LIAADRPEGRLPAGLARWRAVLARAGASRASNGRLARPAGLHEGRDGGYFNGGSGAITRGGTMRSALIAATAAVGLAAVPGVCAEAAAAGKPARSKAFSTIAVGAMISSTGNRFEKVYRIKRSPDGEGGAIQDGNLDGTVFPVTGHDTMLLFFSDGTQMTADTFTLGPPGIDGIGAVTGDGKCTTGTGTHQGETCFYKISGTYDLETTVTTLRLAGTFTRRATTTKTATKPGA
jgi:hypothetical protein